MVNAKINSRKQSKKKSTREHNSKLHFTKPMSPGMRRVDWKLRRNKKVKSLCIIWHNMSIGKGMKHVT